MHTPTWQYDIEDPHTSLDYTSPSTKLEQTNLTRLLWRVSGSTTKVVKMGDVVKVRPSITDINVATVIQAFNAGVNFPQTLSNHVIAESFGGQPRVRKLKRFLRAAVRSGEVTDATRQLAWSAWTSLAKITSRKLIVPDVGIGPDGQILFSWNRNNHHFEMEVFPSGIAELFYLNFDTNEDWEAEYQIGDVFPGDAYNKLALFFAV
jgi:hypothetical protein